MIYDCGDHFDAIGFGVTRIRQLGVPPDSIVAHTNEINNGFIVVTHDRPSKKLWFTIVHPDTRWATIKGAIGI